MMLSRDAKVAKNQKNWLKYNGFSEDGKAYVYVGDTFQIKDELKSNGARYNNVLGWYSATPIDKYPSLKVDVDDICYWVKGGYDRVTRQPYYPGYSYSCDAKSWIMAEAEKANVVIKAKVENPGKHLGTVGAKISAEVTLSRVSGFSGAYGYTNIYEFETADGDTIVWMTTKDITIDKDEKVTISGTVKAHKEYKGKNQTVLNRCEVK